MRNLTFRVIESYTVHNIKEAITINLDDYPETSDMSELEAKEWIQDNIYSMHPTVDVYENLYDQAESQSVVDEWDGDTIETMIEFLDESEETSPFDEYFDEEI